MADRQVPRIQPPPAQNMENNHQGQPGLAAAAVAVAPPGEVPHVQQPAVAVAPGTFVSTGASCTYSGTDSAGWVGGHCGSSSSTPRTA